MVSCWRRRFERFFPDTPITESHPKALLLAFDRTRDQFAEIFKLSGYGNNEHERDATIAAVCAREGFEGRWSTDLADKRRSL